MLVAGGREAAQAASLALMPMPAKLETASGRLVIDAEFSVTTTGNTDPRLASAVARFLKRISLETGIPRPNGPASGKAPALEIECGAGGTYPMLEEDESYRLDIAPSGARLKAATVDGAMHGLETFLQLIQPGADGFQVPALHIEDHPRFPWRGLMLDVSRHWMPLEVVERNLDAMAAVKLNVFHWHLSDDQGFRAESKLYPRLQQLGSDGCFYTQEEMRRVVAYARDRGIRVVPEFDIPGHTASTCSMSTRLAPTILFFAIFQSTMLLTSRMIRLGEPSFARSSSFVMSGTSFGPAQPATRVMISKTIDHLIFISSGLLYVS